MTIDEASKYYKIPIEILQEYERWRLCSSVKKVIGAWKYDDSDLEHLSMIMTLHEIGFDTKEVERYMKLLIEEKNTEEERMRMLNKRRDKALDEIHFREKQLEHVDYLRHKIQKKKHEEYK